MGWITNHLIADPKREFSAGVRLLPSGRLARLKRRGNSYVEYVCGIVRDQSRIVVSDDAAGWGFRLMIWACLLLLWWSTRWVPWYLWTAKLKKKKVLRLTLTQIDMKRSLYWICFLITRSKASLADKEYNIRGRIAIVRLVGRRVGKSIAWRWGSH